MKKDLSEEEEEIQLSIQGNFGSKKQCISNGSIINIKEEVEKEVKINKEDDNLKKSPLAINCPEISEEIQKDLNLRAQQFSKMTDLDSVRQYFEEDWNIDISHYSTFITIAQGGNEHEKKARLKTFYFQISNQFDFFNEQVEKTVLTKEQFDLPPDQLKRVAEPFFEALITRSKVIDLYASCEKLSGKLSGISPLGISEIQACSMRAYYLFGYLSYFLDYQTCFDWNYDKIKGVFDLWEGAFASSSAVWLQEDNQIDTQAYKLWSLVDNDKIQLTKDQKNHFELIFEAVKDIVENGWQDETQLNTEKNSK